MSDSTIYYEITLTSNTLPSDPLCVSDTQEQRSTWKYKLETFSLPSNTVLPPTIKASNVSSGTLYAVFSLQSKCLAGQIPHTVDLNLNFVPPTMARFSIPAEKSGPMASLVYTSPLSLLLYFFFLQISVKIEVIKFSFSFLHCIPFKIFYYVRLHHLNL